MKPLKKLPQIILFGILCYISTSFMSGTFSIPEMDNGIRNVNAGIWLVAVLLYILIELTKEERP